MKIRHALLVALFALLQGMAPLLHAHLGADTTGVSGVHMHGVPHGAAGTGTGGSAEDARHGPGAGPIETPVVGAGAELRRDLSAQPADVASAALSGWNVSPLQGRWLPPAMAVAVPPRTPLRLAPPAHAPPCVPAD